MTSLLVGISGGSGSGKSRLANDLANELGRDRCTVIPFDSYYKDLRHLSLSERDQVNFDHPDSLDAELFGHHLDALAEGMDVCMPVYDFARHQRSDDLVFTPAADVVIAEGILLLAFPELASRFDLKIFRSAPGDLRFSRRVERDVEERGRTAESVREQFERSVAPMHEEFVEPSAAIADRVIEHTEDLDEVVSQLAHQLQLLAV